MSRSRKAERDKAAIAKGGYFLGTGITKIIIWYTFAFHRPSSGMRRPLLPLLALASRAACDPLYPDLPTARGELTLLALLSDGGGTVTVHLPVSPAGSLVTLSRTDGEGSYVPVGRSYDGSDWEAVAGPHARWNYGCINFSTPKRCSIDLPADADAAEPAHRLAIYDASLGERDAAARFLERATFGPTRALLDGWNYTDTSAAARFVHDQIYKEPPSLHTHYHNRRAYAREGQTRILGPHPCEPNSFWRRYAFDASEVGRYVAASTVVVGNETGYVLSVGGHTRTVLSGPIMYYPDRQHWFGKNQKEGPIDMDREYYICTVLSVDGSAYVDDFDVPRTFSLIIPGVGCKEIVGGNPEVRLDPRYVSEDSVQLLDVPAEAPLITLRGNASGELLLHRAPLADPRCADIPEQGAAPVFARLPGGRAAVQDVVGLRQANTVDDPATDGGLAAYARLADRTGTPDVGYGSYDICLNKPMSPFNEAGCRLSTEDACVPKPSQQHGNKDYLYRSTTLDSDTLALLRNETGRHVYALAGLRLGEGGEGNKPCEHRTHSWWAVADDTECIATTEVLHNQTKKALAQWIWASNHHNPDLMRVYFQGHCHADDHDKVGMSVFVGLEGACYTHVHNSHMTVYDLTALVDNDAVDFPFNLSKTGVASYLPSADMTWFEQNYQSESAFGKYIGRYNNDLRYSQLPSELRTAAVETKQPHRLERNYNLAGGTVVCGSDDSVPQDPLLAGDAFDSSTFIPFRQAIKKTIWTMLAIRAPDQIRQRMAWSLASIIPVTPSIMQNRYTSYAYMHFYDIFVRHGLGNYRDVLKEVAYHPQMGEFLSFLNNESLGSTWMRYGQVKFPDENFARELMQLFTIGVVDLHPDGSPVLDAFGHPIKSYTSQDVISFARVMTGYRYSHAWNNIDYMTIDANVRDLWPKRALNGAYLGDRYPLCVDLPDRPHLRAGAKYRIIDVDPTSHDDQMRVVLNPSLDLYGKLCKPDPDGICQFPATVTLENDALCEDPGSLECVLGTLATVQVRAGVFYKYVRPPCVQLAVYQDAKKIKAEGLWPWPEHIRSACANPHMPIATEACCGMAIGNVPKTFFGRKNVIDRPCKIYNERLTYNSNSERCASVGGFECSWVGYRESQTHAQPKPKLCKYHRHSSDKYPEQSIWSWTSHSCKLQMAVDRNGMVASVHKTNEANAAAFVDVNKTRNYYSVHWNRNSFGDEEFPSPENDCGYGACTKITTHDEDKCLCDVQESEEVVFSSLPSRGQALSELRIGAFAPDMYDSGEYELVESFAGVKAYKRKKRRPGVTPLPSTANKCESEEHLGLNSGWTLLWDRKSSSMNVHEKGTITIKGWSDPAIGAYVTSPPSNFSGKRLRLSYKIQMFKVDGTTPHHCEDDLGTCPLLRLKMPDSSYRGEKVDVFGLSKWIPGEWNTFSATVTVPEHWNEVSPLRIISTCGSSGSGHTMHIKDIMYCYVNEGDYNETAVPSALDSTSPSLAPTYDDFSKETIFKVMDEWDKPIYLKNTKSTIVLGELYKIPNIPSFMDPFAPSEMDAAYEIDALIDHLLQHHNAAPFLCKTLIQYFGISNPSPRYITAVSTAFQKGTYEWMKDSSTITFGNGNLGDLAATAAAILLDREAISTVLDNDPTHGSLRQPLVKIISLMRSMEYTRRATAKVSFPMMGGVVGQTGQMAHDFSTVFSFFRPEHTPAGQFAQASLVAPEADILNMGTSIETSNGILSLIQVGLSMWGGGFGASDLNTGDLNFVPESDPTSAEDIIVELATLLTSGRLSQENKEIIIQQYKSTLSTSDNTTALKMAQSLISTTSEFHTTNKILPTNQSREVVEQTESEKPYKAIVYVYLFGGIDSFYMLAPHSSCSIYQDYLLLRTEQAALESTRMLKLNAASSNQSCNDFGLHINLPAFKKIYDAGDGIFLGNTGHMSRPVTHENWFNTQGQLFSHFHMMKEIQHVDPFSERGGSGIVGRIFEVLQNKKHTVQIFGNGGVNVGKISSSKIGTNGAVLLNVNEDMKSNIKNLNNVTESNSGLFGNLWSHTLVDSTNEAERITSILKNVNQPGGFSGGFGGEFQKVAWLIKSQKKRKVSRDSFYIGAGGFDHHAKMKEGLDGKLADLNNGVNQFYEELIKQQMIKNVTVVIASEFGRSLSPNGGNGTDHGWGGNYFVMGGSLKGGRVLGKYPSSFNDDPTNDGRGRVIPTTSWDAVWNSIATWLGVTEDDDLDYILPNRLSFGCNLFTSQDMFEEGYSSTPGCSGIEASFHQRLFLGKARYFSGTEEVAFCKIIENIVGVGSSQKVRCTFVHQKSCEDKHGGITQGQIEDLPSISVVLKFNFDQSDFSDKVILIMNSQKEQIMDNLVSSSDILMDIQEIGETTPYIPGKTFLCNKVSGHPSLTPTLAPSKYPSTLTVVPSTKPSKSASDDPTSSSFVPSGVPSVIPSYLPSDFPSNSPSSKPTNKPSSIPTKAKIICEDDDSFRYKNKEKYTCKKFLKNIKKREKNCNKWDNKNGWLVKNHCPKTCNHCDQRCLDDKNAKIKFGKKKYTCEDVPTNKCAKKDKKKKVVEELCGAKCLFCVPEK